MKSARLLRDFIHDRLYYPNLGYFTKPRHQLGQLTEPLRYSKLEGVHDYYESLGTAYPQYAFLTPVEIFQPWYGYSLASYFLSNREGLLRIIEIGGGTGTAALSILDFYKRNHLQTYERLHYTVLEIAPAIAEACLYRLSSAHPDLVASGRVQVVNKSALEYTQKHADPCFIFALEVMDNLPHDLVVQDSLTKDWKQACVQEKEDGSLQELLCPLSDPTIINLFQLYQTIPAVSFEEREAEEREGFIYSVIKYLSRPKKEQKRVFLPTGCYQLIQHLNKLMPKAEYLLADFDYFRDAIIPGAGAPIVQNKGKLSHEKEEFDTLLVQRGQADIMFPTNFRLLQHTFKTDFHKTGFAYKTHRFMKEHALAKWARTQSGYKPLQDDFHNTSVFITKG